VERLLHPSTQKLIYKGKKPYITEDERKMTERDVARMRSQIGDIAYQRYFNFLVTRIVPDRFSGLNKLDRIALIVLGPLGHFLAGRIAFAGKLQKRRQSGLD
jgi:hypothetical protein